MGASFAGKVCQDPRTEAENCRRLGFPTDWIGKANRYECPLGHKSGTGYVLMLRSDLDAIDVNVPADLIFADGNGGRATLKRLHIADTTCLTPGAPNDKSAVHLVELADHRRYFRLYPMNDACNLVTTPTGNYNTTTAASLTVGRTWQEIWTRIWSYLPSIYAGTAPTLPTTPAVIDGTPQRFDYYGWRAIDAAGHFLARLGMLLCWDPLLDTWSVVKPGTTQSELAAAESASATVRIFDIEPVNVGFGQLPANVQVYFRKEPTAAFGDNPYEVKTVAAPSPARSGQAGTEILFDDLPATYQASTLTNDADLSARATDRANQFFRQRRDYLSTDYRKAYSGALTRFKPGSQVESVIWGDTGNTFGGRDFRNGVTTEVKRLTTRDPMAEWEPTREQPWRQMGIAVEASGGGTPPTGYRDGGLLNFNASTDGLDPLLSIWKYDLGTTRELALFSGFKSGRPVYATISGTQYPAGSVFTNSLTFSGASGTAGTHTLTKGVWLIYGWVSIYLSTFYWVGGVAYGFSAVGSAGVTPNLVPMTLGQTYVFGTWVYQASFTHVAHVDDAGTIVYSATQAPASTTVDMTCTSYAVRLAL
jgi:hypothetical protein